VQEHDVVAKLVECLLDEAELRAFLNGKLARFKIPERIIFSTESLPRLGTGKIDRRALKAQYGK